MVRTEPRTKLHTPSMLFDPASHAPKINTILHIQFRVG